MTRVFLNFSFQKSLTTEKFSISPLYTGERFVAEKISLAEFSRRVLAEILPLAEFSRKLSQKKDHALAEFGRIWQKKS